MKKLLAVLFALMGWFAVITQFVLMVENRTLPIGETITRFFSFFTILTNTLVAVYFTGIACINKDRSKFIGRPGILTALTIYIAMVGLVYQVALRHIWEPEGMQMLVDELLHSVIPVATLLFWYLYEKTNLISYSQIPKWAIYPLTYLIFIMIRGGISSFYPYPFMNVTSLGLTPVLLNSVILIALFFLISCLFVWMGKTFLKR